MKLSDMLRAYPDFIGANGKTEEEIATSEKALGLRFADDYRNYLSEIGLACFDCREITGICASPRLNVVDVTLAAKQSDPTIPADWYVVEETCVDGVIVWQATDGRVYKTAPQAKPVKAGRSLEEYYSKV